MEIMRNLFAPVLCTLFLACASKDAIHRAATLEARNAELEKKQKSLEATVDEMSRQMMLMQAKLEHLSTPTQTTKSASSTSVAKTVEMDRKNTDAPQDLLGSKEERPEAEGARFTNESLRNLKPVDHLGKPVDSKKPAEAEREYNDAYRLFEKKNYQGAIEKMQSFVAKYPQHSYSDNAIYWIAESHFRQKKYELALQNFIQVMEKYPDGNKVADSLLKIGMTYKELGQRLNAKETLEKIQEKYPSSAAARQAKTELEKIRQEGAVR